MFAWFALMIAVLFGEPFEVKAGSFLIASEGRAVPIVYAPEDFKVVSIAANDFATDVERVSGPKPVVQTNVAGIESTAILMGTLGRSSVIDGLVREGKLNVPNLAGQWESFIITVVTNPLPGVTQALVIAGSDRRGTAFGIYEMSQLIGVSPWHWWADVTPEKQSELSVNVSGRRFGPPSVQYRGIFLNDEDWGLQPWAAKTFDPQTGDIGPKTYAKVFELLLRLKANTLWPAMHGCTKPFNSFPENARLADDYAIVMGSSHAEPMLRNNVGEWTDKPENFNYATNRDGVLKYWDERVRANGRFESIYTIGMRGIHDSAMQGPKGAPEQIKLLEQIFTDQRALLAQHVNPHVEQVPQMFCPYKEVLGLFRGGLKVPEDVTVVLPDDNFGYIRDFPSPTELKRSGGFGIYYHLSYLGKPLSYLWLNTTPPALIWEEMSKAYDLGARKIWIVNVGDLKPGEIGTEFFLQMAWDKNRWRRDNLPEFLVEWAGREFGSEPAREIAALMDEYYQLNFQRKPEHLQWWLQGEPRRASVLSDDEVRGRLEAFSRIAAEAERMQSKLPGPKRDAFFELVGYPVRASALAYVRFFSTSDAARAMRADAGLKELTRQFNEVLAGGKWNRLIAIEPADKQWASMRIAPFVPAATADGSKPALATNSPSHLASVPTAESKAGDVWSFIETNGVVSIEAEHFTAKADGASAKWETIPGLGRTGDSVAIFPATTRLQDATKLTSDAPRLDYSIRFASAGEFPLTVYLLPTHPIVGRELRLAIGVDDAPPQIVISAVKDGSAAWSQAVLNASVTATAKLRVTSTGLHTLHLYCVDAGVVVDKLVIDCGGLRPGYLGPRETSGR